MVAEIGKYARQDSNLWPPASEAGALIQLSYGRAIHSCIAILPASANDNVLASAVY